MLFGVRMMLEKLLPLHDILILDEPMKKYCLVRKCKPTMKAPSPQQDAEIGIALADVNAGDIFIQDEVCYVYRISVWWDKKCIK